MGIKETPTNFRVYYKCMKEAFTHKREKAEETLKELITESKVLHESIKENHEIYSNEYDVNIFKYDEFCKNQYINGEFYRESKSIFINKKGNNTLVSCLFDLFRLAKIQKEIKLINHDIYIYDKCISLTQYQYNDILKKYYQKVHERLILEGEGYVISNGIGWICINRCKVNAHSSKIDYAETKKRKQEIIAKGERLYNKEEAEFCKKNGLEYNGVDYRVYLKHDYIYEIPLINSHMVDGRKLRLEITDYRHSSVRGKTNDELSELCNNDITKICKLPIDLKSKLAICIKANNILYTKFIRNEAQESITATKINRKNR